MLVTQFDKFVNRSTIEILGGEITREDLEPMFSTELRDNAVLTDLIATQNGLYIPPQGVDGFRQVLVDVSPNLEELSVTSNGIYIPSGVNGYSKVNVNVPNTYTNADEGKVVENGALIPQTSRPNDITQNGNYDTTKYNSVNVNVPNTYTNADEGKVVDNGALISQSPRPSDITQNGIYDTTLYNSVNVNVASDINNIQYHLGQLKIDTGVITANNNYCYSDLIPLNNPIGYWFIDVARSDMSSFYMGICFFGDDGVTHKGYIRQYEQYRSYQNTSGLGAKYFRIATLVSNLSFASVVYCAENIHIVNNNTSVYKLHQ